MLLGILAAALLGNVLEDQRKIHGQSDIRLGERRIRAG